VATQVEKTIEVEVPVHTAYNQGSDCIDDKVESGKKYYYYLTAVDTTGNVSQLSDVYSEIVP